MTIKQKLFSCLGLFALVTFLLVGAFWTSASASEAALTSVLKDRVVPLQALKKVADSYAVNIVDAAHKARNGNESFAAAERNIRAGSDQLHKSWSEYRATRIEGEEARLATAAEARMKTSDASVDRLLRILDSGDRAGLDRFVTGELYQSIDPVSEAMGKLVDLQIEIASQDTGAALKSAGTALTEMMILAIAAALILGFAYVTITRKVIGPIASLASIIRDLARATGDARLPDLERKDEIGDITRSVDAFLDATLTREREHAAAEAAEQQIVTSSLGESLAALTAGDLTSTISADFPPAYAALKTNFNEALASLRTLIGAVGESASQIRTGSGEIAQASEDLARRTESNAASLEETSAALVQIDTRIKATAEAAERTVRRADQTIATVTGGRSIADEAVQAMGRVSDSAKGIDNVIEGLDKIAFQTRVLAMNAAVEAGRAGEAGRGFAVVADLVSALAMRAEEEAKRARDQLTVTQTEIVSAVDAVTKVDGALQDISGDVGEVHQLLGTMASDNQAQASAITQISAAIGSMDQATQQNAAMVEQTSAAARNLTSEVETLADQAAQFRTGGGDRPRGRKAEPAVAPKHFVPAKPRANGGYVSPVKPLGSNGQANGGFDDWKDF